MNNFVFQFLILFVIYFDTGISHRYSFQLPKVVKPIEYDLWLFPNLLLGTYKGTVKITVNATKEVGSVTLHSKKLSIIETKIDSNKVKYSKNDAYDFLILYNSNLISKGIHIVHIEFSGDMKNKSYGFFRGYEEVNGKRIYFGATFFEPVNARVGFPCFDEPTLKARFSIHVTKPSDYVAISNMNVVKESRYGENYTTVHFAKTPLMSTYLVETFIGKYDFREAKYRKINGKVIPVRMYSPREKLYNTEFPLKEIPKILKWFVNYTGFDYMLPKLDYITLNKKFHITGGMENWGAITCREDSVFYNKRMSILQKSRVLNMAHEFAHTWFGNLLTTSSWGQFWLNEGFARFMDLKATHIYPEHDDAYSSVFGTLQNALWIDDELSINPLVWEVRKPSDAYDILNSINYDKGGSLLRMIEDLIGEDIMKQVLQTYIKKYQYENVVSQDFADTLQNFVNFDATDFLNSFIKQSGYPLITVSQINEDKVSFGKTRFLRMDQAYREGRWTLPIKYITNLNIHNPQLVWFPVDKDNLTINLPKGVKWIKLNPKQGGYYRTNYPESTWQTFGTVMKDFHIRDKMHLLDDSFALVRANKLKCSVPFNLTKYLYDEDRYEAWIAAQYGFRQIRTGLLQNNMSLLPLRRYVSRIVDRQFHRNKWTVKKNETYRTKNTRQIIFNLACAYDHPQCVQKVQELWPKRRKLPVDIYNIVITNRPVTKAKKPPTKKSLIEESTWFGADLSLLNSGTQFKWPRDILEECNIWLKNN